MRSMKRPSRRRRESATTMLKKGRFFAPPRASRMTTMMNTSMTGRIPRKTAHYKLAARLARHDPDPDPPEHRRRPAGGDRHLRLARAPRHGHLRGRSADPRRHDAPP